MTVRRRVFGIIPPGSVRLLEGSGAGALMTMPAVAKSGRHANPATR